jgi:hypothetical protein
MSSLCLWMKFPFEHLSIFFYQPLDKKVTHLTDFPSQIHLVPFMEVRISLVVFMVANMVLIYRTQP